MSCIDGFIGIRAACSADQMGSPGSGLFIEDLEGVDVPRMEGVNSGKWEDAVDFVQQKTDMAFLLMSEEIRPYLEPAWSEELILETGVGGVFDTEDSYTTGLTGDHGLSVRMINTNIRILRVNELFLLFEDDATITFKISDGIVANDKLFTDIQVKAGKVYPLLTDWESSNGIAEITYKADGTKPATGSSATTQLLKNCSTCGSEGFENFTVSGLIEGVEDTNLYGIRARISVECSMEKALCLLKTKFKLPLLYRVGIEILKEWEASDRMNWLTIHSRDWAIDKRAEWEELVYPKLMDQLSRGAASWLKKVDRNCLNCGGVTYGTTHP